MAVHADLTLFGSLVALILLPETKDTRHPSFVENIQEHRPCAEPGPPDRTTLLSATALFSINRLVMAGLLTSTLALFIAQQLGNPIPIVGHMFGVATLTGITLGTSTLISMFSAPVWGALSDRADNRWRTVAAGLVPGILGFGLLTLGSPPGLFTGIPLVAITSGSNQGLSTILIGDTSRRDTRGRQLGLLFTLGDLANAVGPPLAYALIPIIQIRGIYWVSSCLFAIFFLLSLIWSLQTRQCRN